MSPTVLTLPGINGSGPQHWQSLWEQAHPDFQRVQQRDWDHPDCAEWTTVLETAVRNAGPQVVLVAHSLACLVIAHWAASAHSPIKAALLVAPPDCNGPNFPKEAIGFTATPAQAFGFPSTVVISDNDPYGSTEHATRVAKAWGSNVVNIGHFGHINADSGLGDWPQGLELLNQLRR